MGKNKKKQRQASGGRKSSGTEASVGTLVEEIWKLLQDNAGDQLPALWEEYDKLQELVSALRNVQGPCTQRPSRNSVIPEFQKWALENNAVFLENVEIVEVPSSGGFGLRTLRDVQKEEVVLHIPEKMMMSSLTALQGDLGVVIRGDYMLQTMPNVSLALHLLCELSNPSSFWRSYIDFLPREFSLPLFFSKSELMLLQGSPVLVRALLQVRNITKLFSHLYRIIQSAPEGTLTSLKSNFHYDDFLWAVACVMSRQNEIPTPPGHTHPTLALIPVWDLCNHDSGSITTFFSMETHTCDCYAMKDFKSGDEFTIFYGGRTNSELLMQQGFTYLQNKHDRLQLKLGLSLKEEEKTKKLRMDLLSKLNVPVSGLYSLNSEAPVISPDLVAFSRIFTAPMEQLQEWLSLEIPSVKESLMGEWKRCDIKALQFLDVRCRLLLRTYTSSVEEDKRLLETDRSLTENARQIIQLRMCEKIILSNASKYIQLVKEELEKSREHAPVSLSSEEK